MKSFIFLSLLFPISLFISLPQAESTYFSSPRPFIFTLDELATQLRGQRVFPRGNDPVPQEIELKGCKLIIRNNSSMPSFPSVIHSPLTLIDLAEDVPAKLIKKIIRNGQSTRYWGISFRETGLSWYEGQAINRDRIFDQLFLAAQFCKINERPSLYHPSPRFSYVAPSIAAAEMILFKLINQYRQQYNLPPFAFHPKLAELARRHSEDMAIRESMDHHDFISRKNYLFQYHSLVRSSENVAFNYGKENPILNVLEQWQRSPGHHQNMLREWPASEKGYSGIGVSVTRDGKWYFTQLFASQRTQ